MGAYPPPKPAADSSGSPRAKSVARYDLTQAVREAADPEQTPAALRWQKSLAADVAQRTYEAPLTSIVVPEA
jgi:hypothetical protein